MPHPESPSYRARGNWQLLGRNAALHENGLHRLSFWLPGPVGTDVWEGLARVILHRWLVTGGQLWDFKSPYHSRWLSWSCVGCKPSATAPAPCLSPAALLPAMMVYSPSKDPVNSVFCMLSLHRNRNVKQRGRVSFLKGCDPLKKYRSTMF